MRGGGRGYEGKEGVRGGRGKEGWEEGYREERGIAQSETSNFNNRFCPVNQTEVNVYNVRCT